MNDRLTILTQNLLGKKQLSDCELTDIRQLASQYPWMAAARVLLVKKLEQEKDPEWLLELEKAGILFEDKQWLQFLLNETEKNNLTLLNASSADSINTADSGKITVTASLNEPSKSAATATTNNDLIFEPFHTVDYFASQGIRFKPEDQPQDKFGQQLKSFTDWIKAMKKLPLSEVGKSVDPKEERKVEQLAGQSLEQQEVVTEAMAEIWIKQRNYAKAREVYHKLSLLEPSKSAYFASKIKELN